jgi:phage gp46-like protein
MDIAIVFDQQKWQGDFVLAGGALQTDDTLKTAIFISIFTDRRADPGDVIPNDDPNHPGGADPRGWWGDAFLGQMLATQLAAPGVSVKPGFRVGSKLWLLSRSKQTPDVVAKAQEYCEQALEWLIDFGICSAVAVTASVIRQGVLGITVKLSRNRSAKTEQFDYVWGA